MDVTKRSLAWIVFIFACGAILVSAEEIKKFGVEGSSINLPCDLPKSDPPNITWFDWVHNTDRNPKHIFTSVDGSSALDTSHPNTVNYEVDEEDYSLTINNLSPETDPGQYVCQSTVNRVASLLTYNIGIGEKPKCSGKNSLTAGEVTDLNCESTYGGVAPTLTWYRGVDNQLVVSDDHADLGMVRRVVPLTASPDDDMRTYTCQQTFGESVEKCNVTLHVTYSVQNISLSPLKDTYGVNEVVTCKARGQPAPDIELRTEPALSGSDTLQSVLIPAEWAGQQITIRCSAKNTVNGEEKTIDLEKRVMITLPTPTEPPKVETAKPDPAGPDGPDGPDAEADGDATPTPTSAASTAGTSSTIIIVVIVVAVVVILVIVAFICMRRRKQQKNKGAKRVPTNEAQAEMNSRNQRV